MREKGGLLAGKVALVTGASRGIGRGIAQRLASEGALVVVTARTLHRDSKACPAHLAGTLSETVALIRDAGGTALAIAADLEKEEDRACLMQEAVAQAGSVDILVNNAGFTRFAPFPLMERTLFERTLNFYLRIPFLLAQAVIPGMQARGAGWIVNIGSVAALRPLEGRNLVLGDTIYAACKAALGRMTLGMAAELLPDNIAVNLAAPSTAIRTPGGGALIPEDFPAEDIEYLAETVLALTHLPAHERSGLFVYSLHFPKEMNLTVHTLDGKREMPPRDPPEWSHPDIRSLIDTVEGGARP